MIKSRVEKSMTVINSERDGAANARPVIMTQKSRRNFYINGNSISAEC